MHFESLNTGYSAIIDHLFCVKSANPDLSHDEGNASFFGIISADEESKRLRARRYLTKTTFYAENRVRIGR